MGVDKNHEAAWVGCTEDFELKAWQMSPEARRYKE